MKKQFSFENSTTVWTFRAKERCVEIERALGPHLTSLFGIGVDALSNYIEVRCSNRIEDQNVDETVLLYIRLVCTELRKTSKMTSKIPNFFPIAEFARLADCSNDLAIFATDIIREIDDTFFFSDPLILNKLDLFLLKSIPRETLHILLSLFKKRPETCLRAAFLIAEESKSVTGGPKDLIEMITNPYIRAILYAKYIRDEKSIFLDF